jgi:hypothetical protein
MLVLRNYLHYVSNHEFYEYETPQVCGWVFFASDEFFEQWFVCEQTYNIFKCSVLVGLLDRNIKIYLQIC